jgi:hypothetical protein
MPSPRFLVWVGVRDPSCATNVTLRHHECDSRRDPTRAGASVRAPSLTRMGSRACYRGWRFKQGPLDLSWGNGETGNGSRTRRCDALHHDLAVAPRGRVCCWQTQQSRRASPSLPLEQTAPWDILPRTSSCHRLSLHRPHPITCSIPMQPSVAQFASRTLP